MANIFISYNSENEDRTKALVEDIKELGHSVWFDKELGGGQIWWDKILETIRNCDLFVFVLSVEGLDSSACNLEYEYANELGKTILPILIGEKISVNLLPPALSKIQFVDYRKRDRDALLHLARAFTTAPPSQTPPDPLPLPPEVPVSYLGSLGKQIENTSKLSYEEQSALLVDLKKSLHDPESATDALTLLKKLRKQQHLFENIAQEIDLLLENTVQTAMVTSDKDKEILTETEMKPQKQNISLNTQNNINQNSGNRGKIIVFVFVIVLLLIAGGAVYFYFNQPSPSGTTDTELIRKNYEERERLQQEKIQDYNVELKYLKQEKAERERTEAERVQREAEEAKKKTRTHKIEEMYFKENGIEISVAYPDYVRAGESFVIQAIMVNHNAVARMGGLTLSFPDRVSMRGEFIQNSFDKVNSYMPPAKLYSSITRGNIYSKYFVVEGWQNKWSYGRSKSFSVRLTAPRDIRHLRVNVRGVLHVGTSKRNKREVIIPTRSSTIDQQGYYTKQFGIIIKN